MDSGGSERQPPEKLVTAQLKSPGGTGPWPECEHAEAEAGGYRAQTEGLCDLPRHGG